MFSGIHLYIMGIQWYILSVVYNSTLWVYKGVQSYLIGLQWYTIYIVGLQWYKFVYYGYTMVYNGCSVVDNGDKQPGVYRMAQ